MNEATEKSLFLAIGNNIKTSRNNARLNQAHLAAMVGLSRTSLVNIEQGKQHPSVFMLWRIADALNIELKELLPGKAQVSAMTSGLQPVMDSIYIKNDQSFTNIRQFHQNIQDNLAHESQATEGD